MKQEIMDWLEHWLVDCLVCDSVTPSALVTGTSLGNNEIRHVAVGFIYAGLVSGTLELLPEGVLFGGGDLGFNGPLDYAQELMKFNPFEFDDLLAGRAAWGGPQIALSKAGRDLLANLHLELAGLSEDEREVRCRQFLSEMIRRFETAGVSLGEVAFVASDDGPGAAIKNASE